MKSKQRHALKTNELQKLRERMAPLLERHGNHILWGLCCVAMVMAIVAWWFRSSSEASSAAWTRFYSAQTGQPGSDNFGTIAEDYKGSVVGAWASLFEAEVALQNGVRLSFEDRSEGNSELKKAKKAFKNLLSASPLPDRVHERALYGLARCLETMADSDTSQAVAAYETLNRTFPNSMYKKIAEKQISVLKTGGAQQFYAWFHNQNPTRPEPGKPKDGMPSGIGDSELGDLMDAFDPKLPEIPDLLTLPEAGDKPPQSK